MPEFDGRAFMASVRREAGERRPPELHWHTLQTLLHMEGQDFLETAYHMMLHREPDPAGVQTYLARASSRMGRLRILVDLLLSPEQTWMPTWLWRGLLQLRHSVALIWRGLKHLRRC